MRRLPYGLSRPWQPLLASSAEHPRPWRWGATYELTPDGAWCWYSAPRAIYHNGTVYTGWVTRDGDIQVAEHDLLSGITSDPVTLWPRFEADDHDHPVMHVTSDGRLTAFYSKHALAYTRTQYHISVNP